MISVKRLTVAMTLVAASCLVATAVVAAEPAEANVASKMPAHVRQLLIQEMNAVLDASKRILDALVRGQDDVVAENTQAIHDSFILRRQMTPEDKQALLEAVPEAFVERDQAFHEVSARLAEAAREKDTARQLRLFNDMVGACVECHSRHATERFPALSGPERNE